MCRPTRQAQRIGLHQSNLPKKDTQPSKLGQSWRIARTHSVMSRYDLPRPDDKSGHCHRRFYCYLAATFAAVSFQPVRRHRYSWIPAPPSDD